MSCVNIYRIKKERSDEFKQSGREFQQTGSATLKARTRSKGANSPRFAGTFAE